MKPAELWPAPPPGTSKLSAVEIRVIDIRPDDVMVIECDGLVDQDQREQITAVLLSVWPNRKSLVLDRSMRLQVVREVQPTPEPPRPVKVQKRRLVRRSHGTTRNTR